MGIKATPWVLVVDPDPRIGQMCADVLGPLGHTIHAASTGAGAFDAVEQLGPPLGLVTELELPDVNAFTLLQRLRAFTNTPFAAVILTETPSARTAARAIQAGLDGYLIKGADSVEELRATLQRAIRRLARRRELERVLDELTHLNEDFMVSMRTLRRANTELERRLAESPVPTDAAWRVLVVDDDVSVVAVLETLLGSQGHIVEGATSGAAAREAFLNRHYDLVLTDKNLGDANGVDLVREFHAIAPDCRILLMTGYATVESAVDAIESGVAGLLRKPFDDLGQVVNRVDEELAHLGELRAERRYFDTFRAQYAEFEARFRLIRNKLGTLQGEPT